jgi:hypothetical protein
MKSEPSPLILEEDGDQFVISREESDGTESSMHISEQDVLNLSQSAAQLAKHILSKRNLPKASGVEVVVATPIAQFRVAHDSLAEEVLLTLVSRNGVHTMFAIHPDIVRLLASKLEEEIVKIDAAKRQVRQ